MVLTSSGPRLCSGSVRSFASRLPPLAVSCDLDQRLRQVRMKRSRYVRHGRRSPCPAPPGMLRPRCRACRRPQRMLSGASGVAPAAGAVLSQAGYEQAASAGDHQRGLGSAGDLNPLPPRLAYTRPSYRRENRPADRLRQWLLTIVLCCRRWPALGAAPCRSRGTSSISGRAGQQLLLASKHAPPTPARHSLWDPAGGKLLRRRQHRHGP